MRTILLSAYKVPHMGMQKITLSSLSLKSSQSNKGAMGGQTWSPRVCVSKANSDDPPSVSVTQLPTVFLGAGTLCALNRHTLDWTSTLDPANNNHELLYQVSLLLVKYLFPKPCKWLFPTYFHRHPGHGPREVTILRIPSMLEVSWNRRLGPGAGC